MEGKDLYSKVIELFNQVLDYFNQTIIYLVILSESERYFERR